MHSVFSTYTTEECGSQIMHKGITGSIPNNEVKTYTGMLCLKSKHNPVAAMGHIMPICPWRYLWRIRNQFMIHTLSILLIIKTNIIYWNWKLEYIIKCSRYRSWNSGALWWGIIALSKLKIQIKFETKQTIMCQHEYCEKCHFSQWYNLYFLSIQA